jgi:hypothetical protein
VTVPDIYNALGNLRGNFSILELPALPGGGPTPALYTGEATYYTSITHKPLVGGYVTRENLTEELSLYNIPLVVQAATLSSYGSATFSSPVNENFTAQTLLSLYNYDTAFVVVMKSAYNQTTLIKLLGYLFGVFGNPVYNDNTTIAFQTLKKINESIFRSYASYPIATEWQATAIPFNGTYARVWVPSSPGAIAVYAPCQNTNLLNSTSRFQQQLINTKISFSAIANRPSTLLIEEQTSANASKVAEFNITNTMEKYSADTALVSGPRGNMLFFVEDQNSPVFISNITFSRAG